MVTLQRPAEPDCAITSWFGETAGRRQPHHGIDFGWRLLFPVRTQRIYAAAPGRVTTTFTTATDSNSDKPGKPGWNTGWGNRVVIEHGPKVETSYSHIRAGGVLVKPGDWVQAGQLIGLYGTTGDSTGRHLHFELYLGGVRVDPAPYLNGKPLPIDPPKPPTPTTKLVRAPGGEKNAPLWPEGPLMERIQRGLKARDRYDGECDGIGAAKTAKGIQITLNTARLNGRTGFIRTRVDGALGGNNSYGVQRYGAKYGGYTGPIDGDPRMLSWEAFAQGLDPQ